MNELNKLIDQGKLWSYLNYDHDVTGIIVADNEDDALRKVVDGYNKHGYSDTDFEYTVEVKQIKGKPFDDAPDVLETNYWNA